MARLTKRLLLALVLVAAAPLMAQISYPTLPVMTNIGPLFCGARLLAAGQVQTYCISGTTPSVTICNSLDILSDPGLPAGSSPSAYKICSTVDAKGNAATVSWGLWIIPNPGPIQYNIQSAACTVPLPNTTPQPICPGGTPVTTQTGTLPF